MRTYLITGGAGFVGSNLAVRLKQHHSQVRVIAFDNLKRRGAELNLFRLEAHGVEFVHGDVRSKADLELGTRIDCLIECAAEPSVLAGYNSSPAYVIGTNLIGAINCLEVARQHNADFIFLSTSRVYPFATINALRCVETETRYELSQEQSVPGVSPAGLSEAFPLAGTRSLYGATKLASELIIHEYLTMYGLRGVINRCGVIAGPWQMGKVDQGFVTFWVARHVFGGELNYLGFGGTGKQVRDILHVDDLYGLLELQLAQLDTVNGQTFNVGGGRGISISLCELTELCAQVTGMRVNIGRVAETRPADVRLYLSDYRKVRKQTGWEPQITPPMVAEEITAWICDNRQTLAPILA